MPTKSAAEVRVHVEGGGGLGAAGGKPYVAAQGLLTAVTGALRPPNAPYKC